MFQVEHVEIEGFWGRYNASVDLHPDVNIFIGRNGSGKTTFINLLQAVLRVDLRGLSVYDFNSINIRLWHDGRIRKFNVTRERREELTDVIRFKVGTRSWTLPLFSPDVDIGRQYRVRPQRQREYLELRGYVHSLVKIASLSVHRTVYDLSSDEEYASRQRRLAIPAIDERVNELVQQLTVYQLLLAERASQISIRFQKDVLVSMLYDTEFDRIDLVGMRKVEFGKEKEDLTSAYKELGALDPLITERIDKHIEILKRSINKAKETSKPLLINDIMPLSLLRRTQHIIKLSLQAERDKQEVFVPMRMFLLILSQFLKDKNIQITPAGDFVVRKGDRVIPNLQLSSGEKQLLILMTQTLLQKGEPFVFLADEPELSLHIEWQENVISSIKCLNSKAQIIVATHSPEIAAGWKNRVHDMEDIIHENA